MALPSPEDALAGYHFTLEFDGVAVAQFKEVSGISMEIQTIEHRENKVGGLPVLKKLPGNVKFGDVTLKKGKTDSTAFHDWFQMVKDGNMPQARKNGSIVLFDYAHGEISRYNFTNAWPSKLSLGGLNSGGNDILLEELTLTHEGVEIAK